MYLNVDRELTRCERVIRQRVSPYVDTALSTCQIRSHENPGEPVPPTLFLEDARSGRVEFRPFRLGTIWGTTWGTTWFELRGKIPVDILNPVPDRSIELDIDLGWHPDFVGGHIEGMVFRPDGTVVKAVHPLNAWVPLIGSAGVDSAIAADGSFTLYLEAACNPVILGTPSFVKTELGYGPTGRPDQPYVFRKADICLHDREMDAYRADLDAVSQLISIQDKDSLWYWTLAKSLQRSMNLYDDQNRGRTVGPARQALAKVLSTPAERVGLRHTAIGHAHIDSAWLWPVRETRRKVARTVSNVLALMDEDPEFTYAMSSAQQYAWLEESYPDLFARVKARIAEGRFIPVGGMWVESDGMMPSGEALIRQISFGQRYFRDKFGLSPKGIWLPDSFGYTGAFPQIARRSGYQWFLTQKIAWSDTTRFPHHSFIWQGIDGSRILTHFPPSDTYGSQVSAKELQYSERNFKDKDLSDQAMILYGYGDGGGGPTRQMLGRVHRFADLQGVPPITIGTPDEFFESLRRKMPANAGTEMPVWKGELYLELHRATLTSQQDMKRGCRQEESLLRMTEYLCAMAALDSGSYVYPRRDLDRIWKALLLNQFHDILPGSAIAWVHRQARETYKRDLARLEGLIRSACNALTANHPDLPVLPQAQLLPFAQAGGSWTPQPPIRQGRTVNLTQTEEGCLLDNGLLRVRLNNAGAVTSCVDTTRNLEIVAEGELMGVYEHFIDQPSMWDAWDIERDALLTGKTVTESRIIQAKVDQNGSAEVTVQAGYGTSSFRTVISLSPKSSSLDFSARIDWREKERFLKVRMPISIIADQGQFECQYGYVNRPVTKNSPEEEAKFESCTHRFVRIADSCQAVSIANASTYGADAYPLRNDSGNPSGTMVRLSLLEAPIFPDPDTDTGIHDFHWTISASDSLADTLGEASRVNAPILSDVPEIEPPVVLDSLQGTVVIDWIKLADDGTGDLIMRLYEAAGSTAKVRLQPSSAFAGAVIRETDTLEGDNLPADEPRALTSPNGSAISSAELVFSPFQLATLRVTR